MTNPGPASLASVNQATGVTATWTDPSGTALRTPSGGSLSLSGQNRFNGAPLTTPSRMIIFGDSISLASSNPNGGSAANTWSHKLAAYYGLGMGGTGTPDSSTLIESAVSGYTHLRYLNALNNSIAFTSNDLVVGLPLYNTLRALGPDPHYQYDLQQAMEALYAWYCIPESLKVRAVNAGTTTPNSAVTTSGSWAYFAVSVGTDLNNLCLRGSSVNATATFPTVTGDTIYVWFVKPFTGERWSVIIDGVTHTIGGLSSYSSFINGTNSWEFNLARFVGLTNTTHTVVCKNDQGDNIDVIAIAGFSSQTVTTQCAAVAVGDCLPATSKVASQGYDLGAGLRFNSNLYSNDRGPKVAMSLGASPATYTATADGYVVISGGTVSAIAISRDQSTFDTTGATTGEFFLAAGDQIKVTYTGAPTTANFYPSASAYLTGHAGNALYNQINERAVKNLQQDGLRIQLVNVANSVSIGQSGSVDISTDFIHPSDTGYEKIFRRFRQALTQ